MTDLDDDRDPRFAAMLAVESLDDVTKARLVRTAVVARRKGARTRWVALAATAAVLVVAVAVAVAVLAGGSDTEPTAARAPTVESPTKLERGLGENSAGAPSAATAEAAVAGLGDLGDVSTAAALRRAVAGAARSGLVHPDACVVAAARPVGTVVAAGTGTADGRPVTVVIAQPATGGRRAVVVEADCAARPPVRL